MQFETKAIHAGQASDPSTGAVIVPVFQTSTYQQEALGKHKGYEYSRTGNPTRTALETCLAELEGGRYGLAFSSGLAATTAVFSLFGQGAHIVLGDDLYGGTYRLMEQVFRKWGISATYADVDDPESFSQSLTARTRLIWIESPTNPLLKVLDIEHLARIAKAAGVLLAVDNTFASPYFQNPLTLGADIVVHSTTKYINGHSDLVGGAVVVNDESLYRELKFLQNAAGAVPGPWDCWLTLRGLRTLAVRMREHEKNARCLAEFLCRHEKVARVYYPGLAGTKDHEIATRQMRGFGGMLSFEIRGGIPAVERFLAGLKVFLLAESLGGVESLVSHPARMTHASLPEAQRRQRGITDSLIRLSVGIENVEDLKADLENALRNI
jgi:cystathionine beta-lyase/cystathionine gamma-synthase